jgi:hypothetical protein
MRPISLDPAALRQRNRGERIRCMVRLLLTYNTNHHLKDVWHYSRLCSCAETLIKQYGLAVRIRGKRNRWLIEIPGGRQAKRRRSGPAQRKSQLTLLTLPRIAPTSHH